jgi:hypothetical protein
MVFCPTSAPSVSQIESFVKYLGHYYSFLPLLHSIGIVPKPESFEVTHRANQERIGK